ncbi:MAG TPA: TonB-dependent receptor [Terracidiphilus sp.]|nr:TonB-dependent receptor [Terracidiphilus sp.]
MQWILPTLLLGGGLLISGSTVCFAQNTSSGDVRGVVTDPTGAVVPGVTVTANDMDKGVTTVYTTDATGLFDTGPIAPDRYTLTFTKTGFKSYVRGPITVNVGIQTVNAQLAVGSTTQQVMVTTELPLLSTESGAIEGTLQSKTMKDLPQVGADWQNFIVLMPGAAGAPENSSNALNPQQVASINGNLPYASVLADGATTTLPMSQNSDVTIFETTSEVKVSDTAFSAQYGVGDIVYNQITKSGTNHFHGEAYEYVQNNALNAAPYGFGSNLKVPILHYNNFGFNVGGPVKPLKKVFFFFDYDRTIDKGGASNGFITVPSSAMMSGDFTAPGMPTLYDPTTQTLVTSGSCTYTGPQYPDGFLSTPAPCVQRKSFISEYGSNKIPTSMINPAAQAIQKYFPAPNIQGALTNGYYTNNYAYNVPNSYPFIRYFGRLDWNITQNNRFTASETESNWPATFLNQGICPINCQNGDVSRDNAQVSDVWTLSPRLINEFRMGFTNQLNFFTPYGIGQGWAQKLNVPFLADDEFPNIGISNFYGLGSSSNAVYKEFVFDPSDVITLIKGRHVLHFGGEFLIDRADSTAWGNLNAGSFNFNGDYTSAGGGATNAYDGLSYADFLLGQTNNWNALNKPEWGGRMKTPQLFIQDDWKARNNLTVNLGLRYEGETGWSEVKGNEAVFDPAVQNFDSSKGVPVQGGMWYGFLGQNGRTALQAPKYNIVLPRLGFSWGIRNNTVLKGGIGVYASTWSEDTYGAGMGNAFGSSGNYGDPTNGFCPIIQLNADGTAPDTVDPNCAANAVALKSKYITAPTTPWALNGQGGIAYNQYHTPVPKNYQWTLGLQREFASEFVGEVDYVGNHGTGLNFPVDINQVPESLLGPNDLQNEPYPLYQSINGCTNNAISNYHALEAVITKRMTSGLQFSANYTWSHFLDEQDSSGWGGRGGWQNYQNAFNPRENYSQSNFDIRHMFKGYAVYKLPFGKDGLFLKNSTLADEIVGGWQISSTFMAQGGNPLSITTGNNNSSNNQSGGYTQYANLVGNYKTADSVSGNKYHSLNEWYNLQAFAVPAPYTYGTFRRNVVVGPGLTDVNFSVGKTFDLWPEHNIQFQIRGDATNILNHPSFAQPGNNAIGSGQSAQITGVTVGGRAWQIYSHLTF